MLDNKLSLDLILIIDENSRKKIKVNVSNLVAYNVEIISSLKEATEDMLNKTKRIVILEDYIRETNFLSELRLYKSILNIEIIYLSQDELWLTILADICSCYKMDISLLDYEMLYAVSFKDLVYLEKFTKVETDFRIDHDLLNAVLEDDRYDNVAKSVAVMANNLTDAYNYKSISETNLKQRVQELERKNLVLEIQNEKIIKGYRQILLDAMEQSKALEQFESILVQDIYDKVSLVDYDRKPNIIYFKEYQEILHLNSFIETLFDMYRLQAKKSCKVLLLLDSSASKRVLRIPSYYKVIKNKYINSDIISSDFIVKIGDYRKTLDFLLRNRIKLDTLIIVDCKDHNDTVISGLNFYFNMCRNEKFLPNYAITEQNTIVSNSTSLLSWDDYKEYKSFEDLNDRFLFLSSRPVIQKIYELTELYSSSVLR